MTESLTQFEAFFVIPQRIMSLIGIPLNLNKERLKKSTKWQGIRFWFLFINLFVGAVASYISLIGADFKLFTFQMPLNAYATCGLVEVMLIWWNKERISAILCDLNDKYQKHCLGATEQREMRLILVHTRTQMKRFICLFCVLIGLFNLVPLYVLFKEYQASGALQLQLPYYVWFPFDPYANSYVFPLIFLEENLWGATAITMIVLDSLTLGSIVAQLRLHYDLLAKKLRTIGGRPTALSPLIEQHQKLIGITEEVADVFSGSLLSNYIFNSFIICLAIFQIVYNEVYEDAIKFVFLLLCVLLQTLALSYYGDQITEYVGRRISLKRWK